MIKKTLFYDHITLLINLKRIHHVFLKGRLCSRINCKEWLSIFNIFPYFFSDWSPKVSTYSTCDLISVVILFIHARNVAKLAVMTNKIILQLRILQQSCSLYDTVKFVITNSSGYSSKPLHFILNMAIVFILPLNICYTSSSLYSGLLLHFKWQQIY